MKFEISFERVYPHPPEKVWRSITDPAALGEWLMQTDFEPKVGREFNMWCDDGAGGTDRYICRALEYEPPKRMLWSWILDGSQNLDETLVAFRVAPVSDGSKLTITHSGDRDTDTIERFKGGWPVKLDALDGMLSEGQETCPHPSTNIARSLTAVPNFADPVHGPYHVNSAGHRDRCCEAVCCSKTSWG